MTKNCHVLFECFHSSPNRLFVSNRRRRKTGGSMPLLTNAGKNRTHEANPIKTILTKFVSALSNCNLMKFMILTEIINLLPSIVFSG